MLERAHGGEAAGLAELLESLRPDVLRLCTRLLGPVDAEDAVHECFQRALHRFDSYDATQPFRRWLLSIAAHGCIDRLRRRDLEGRLFESDAGGADIEALAARGPSALDAVVQGESRQTLLAALDRLPDRYRAPLVLRYFAELGYDAIGEQLGVTRSQVASLLFVGKQRLRSLLPGARERRR